MEAPLTVPARFRLGIGVDVLLVDGEASESDFLSELSDAKRLETIKVVRRLVDVARPLLGNSSVRTISDISEISGLFEPEVEVVTLLAHSPNPETVELGVRRFSWDEVVSHCPRTFRGMIDLRGCVSFRAGDSFRRSLPHSTIRDRESTLGVEFACWSYARALALVAKHHIPFDRAATQAWSELQNHG